MYSCDNLLLSKMISNSSYKELSLANGIANNLRIINYGNYDIYFPDGRGYLDYTYILDKHNILYENISIGELKHLKNYDDIILLIPKEYLDYQEKIKRNITQLAIVYSAFEVKRIKGDRITLSLAENRWSDYCRELSINYLEILESISVKPLGYLIKVILIKQKSMNLTKEEIRVRIRENAMDCLTNSKCILENTECISGIQFYSLLEMKIIELSKLDMEISKNRIAIFIFAVALNAGGAAFYRKDFANALLEGEYLPLKISSYINNCFDKAIMAWEELQRIVRFLQKGEKRYVTEEKVHKLLRDIQDNEVAILLTLDKVI